jgi:hypothetical protein
VPESPLPPRSGWYRDPYRAGSIRWFDGSQWTTHAVASDQQDPDHVVEHDWKGPTPETTRQEEWEEQFPKWDVAVARGDEPPFDGGGGVGGLEANRVARLATRYSSVVYHPIPWLGALVVLLALLAWGDPAHRMPLIVAASVLFAVTIVAEMRAKAARAHWKRVGMHE